MPFAKKLLSDIFEEALAKVHFPNYHKFENTDDAYSNFIPKVLAVIVPVAPIKSRRIKEKLTRMVRR